MKIGILQADSVRETLIPTFGNYPQMFERLFQSSALNDCHGPSHLSFRTYPVYQNVFPNRIDECDAYVITGSQYCTNQQFEWIGQLSDFILRLHNHQVKLVGICFGHQLIAQALGGQVERALSGWGVGVHIYQMYDHFGWQTPAQDNIALLVSHQDQIVVLPEEMECIGGSAFCPYALCTVGDHILTTQAHPEFTKTYADQLMHLRIEQLGEELFDQAQHSLSQEIDNQIVAQWLLNFMTPNNAPCIWSRGHNNKTHHYPIHNNS